MSLSLKAINGLRVAVEGCGHGTLHAIYAAVGEACKNRGWNGVDLLIIGGDFQAVRNASDLTVMSCPVKYRAIGDFHLYYSGATAAPFLTIFVGGNHEASSHLWELFYGGWVAPNIFYMGAANVVRVGGVRIVGMSGIWKGYNYNKPHHERLPYNQDDVKSIYHTREIDIRKLLQLQTQVDIGISHDWPRAIEKHGNFRGLFNMKPDFEQESRDGTLGNQAASYVMDRLRPPYWFAAHMHCKFSAIKTYEDEHKRDDTLDAVNVANLQTSVVNTSHRQIPAVASTRNADEIDLDMDDDDGPQAAPSAPHNTDDIDIDMGDVDLPVPPQQEYREQRATSPDIVTPNTSSVPLDIRAQLPAAFSRPAPLSQRLQPGQPCPPGVTNKTVRFLALDKCLPGRKFLQLLEVLPQKSPELHPSVVTKPKFEYDPEWLAITRVFANEIILGDKHAKSEDLGEDRYRSLIDKEQKWVDENIVQKGKLEIPENFELTAPIYMIGMPEIVRETPKEYNNPQMQQFCDLVGIENKFFATEEEREQRLRSGPAPSEERRGGFGGRGRFNGRGRGGGRGGRSWGNRVRGRGRR